MIKHSICLLLLSVFCVNGSEARRKPAGESARFRLSRLKPGVDIVDGEIAGTPRPLQSDVNALKRQKLQQQPQPLTSYEQNKENLLREIANIKAEQALLARCNQHAKTSGVVATLEALPKGLHVDMKLNNRFVVEKKTISPATTQQSQVATQSLPVELELAAKQLMRMRQ